MAVVVVTDAMTRQAFAATAAQPSPADAERFREGDAVVYSAHGVGRIDRIGTETIAGHSIEIIQVSFLENQMTVRIPAAKARTAGLRKLSTPDAVEKAVAVLNGRARISKLMWAKRAQEYQGKINSGDPMVLAEVLRDLRRNADGVEGSYSERNIFEAALDRLASEIAAVDGRDKLAVIARLTEVLKEAPAAAQPAAS